jgi:RNA polymerase sigma-70 factor, ECF subfamily
LIDNETELIKRSQQGDTDAFCLLTQQHSRRIHLLALHYCRNAQDAEDLSQEVWLKAFRALGTFRFDSSFYTWLRKITINTFLNHQRSSSFLRRGQSAQVESLNCETFDVESHFNSEESIYNKVLFDAVLTALSELTPSQRLMFLLRHYEGMSYEEISRELNCSTGTAKKAVWRAIGKLKAKLNTNNETTDEGVSRFATDYEAGVSNA